MIKRGNTLIIGLLLIVLTATLPLRAETARAVRIPVHFRLNEVQYDPTFASNQAAMDSIFHLIDSLGLDRIHGIEVTGYASPEGVYEYNRNISLHRARSVAKILRARYMPVATRVHVDAGGEAWEALRERVAADTRLSDASREKILRILDDSSISNDTRKWRLANRLGNDPKLGPLYPWLLRNHHRKLRYGVLVMIYEKAPDQPAAAEPTVEPQPDERPDAPAVPAVDSVKAETQTVSPDTLKALPDTLVGARDSISSPVDSFAISTGTIPSRDEIIVEQDAQTFHPVIGLSTNLLYDVTYIPGYGVTSIPSVGLEYYPTSGHWTWGVDVEWPMWKHWDTHRFMQIQNITFSGRRYFNEKELRYKGLYLLGNLNLGRYGIGFNNKGWEGEGIGLSAGIGHKWLLGKRFYFDLGIAAGLFYSAYDPFVYEDNALGWYYYDYAGKPEDFTRRNNRWLWFGPTRVWASFGIDLFNRRVKQ